MVIIEDSRQQKGKHGQKHKDFERAGDKLVVCKLPWGDYALPPKVSVDTKRDIYELAGNMDADHKRFAKEMDEAREAGTKLFILVENLDGVRSLEDLSKWVEDAGHFAMRKRVSPKARIITGKRLATACKTMEEHHGCTFLFCSPKESAQIIKGLLLDG